MDAVFWGLLVFAMAAGGRDALSGLPAFAALLLPQNLPREHVADAAYASFVTPIGKASKYEPQVLQPVTSQPPPEWLGVNQPLHLRRSHTDDAESGNHSAKIAIVIDDMGGDAAQSRRAIALPRSISLSFLPYPENAPALARSALREGHEILVHLPMEPEGKSNPGPNALRTDLAADENLRRLAWNLSRIPGFDGVNNHEGSKFTADRAALVPVMEALAQRHVFFLDSRTTVNTQVVTVAHAFGVASTGRDVFLDDNDSPKAMDAQLRLTERMARQNGVAIAIGHPRANTLDALWRWCGEISSRGYVLIPVREAIRLKTQRDLREASLTPH